MAQPKRKTATNRGAAKPIDTRLSALRSDLDSLQENARSFVGDVGSVANDGASAAIEAARNLAERAYRLADEARASVTDDVEEWASDNLDAARETVREQPLAAIAVALGVGALFGAVLLRR
ncbi:MAG TPA: hypothetical protein VK479_06905 [Micropepsaceae bacterium]|jgi:ElaB/YqjD/DUF883 family membrane-anchored ribosome-binding protein|nr:hypothetical protein [Micropepsaceae bacterium]